MNATKMCASIRASTSVYVEPLSRVGRKGFPRATVRSGPFPPRGPICWYCPEAGAFWAEFQPGGTFCHYKTPILKSLPVLWASWRGDRIAPLWPFSDASRRPTLTRRPLILYWRPVLA